MHGMTVQMVVMLKMAVPKAAIEVVEDVEWMLMDEPKPLAVLVMQMLVMMLVMLKMVVKVQVIWNFLQLNEKVWRMLGSL